MFIKDMTFYYNKALIFDRFNFESNSNFIVIKGPTGCGKTTLLKLISGNLEPFDIADMKEFSSSSMIIQEDALFPWLSGFENIRKVLNIECEEIFRHSIYPYVEPFVHKRSCEMSYGQRRLIELFRIFLYKPKLLCLDEPFNFLDSKFRNIVSKMLNSSALRSNETVIIMSSHYNEDLADINSEVFYFDGKFPINKLFKYNKFKDDVQ